MKVLHLVMNGRVVGRLEQTRGGATRLLVPPSADAPRLSLAFAPSQLPISPRQTRAYLAGLLPDAASTREAIARIHGVSPESPFALIEAIGRDCPGAVQFLSDEALSEPKAGELEPVSEADIAKRLRGMRRAPGSSWMRAQEHWSLGGAQDKFALTRQASGWTEAHGAAATTHIIKPGITALPHQALIEHLSLRALDLIGVDTAESEYLSFEDEPAIVVTRFDRLVEDGEVLRAHQEDFCQATSTLPQQKYRVTAQKAREALRRGGAAPEESDRLAIGIVANWVLGAPDGHAKNFSAFLTSQTVALTPLYDVATGLGQGDRPDLAMGIGGEKRITQIRRQHLEAFATSMDIVPDQLVILARTMANHLPEAFAQARQQTSIDGHDAEAHVEQTLAALALHCAHVTTALR